MSGTVYDGRSSVDSQSTGYDIILSKAMHNDEHHVMFEVKKYCLNI